MFKREGGRTEKRKTCTKSKECFTWPSRTLKKEEEVGEENLFAKGQRGGEKGEGKNL